jgi:hypothetical protein
MGLWANDFLVFAVRHFVRSEQRGEAANQSAGQGISGLGCVWQVGRRSAPAWHQLGGWRRLQTW